MSEVSTVMTAPGEISGWPKLKIVYRTDPRRIAELLPPGLTPGRDPHVHINVYCVPVLDEPEHGVSTKVEAAFDGIPGLYSLGMGIDQEAAIFVSQNTNGQPKFPCDIRFFRFGDAVEARCTHHGYTFMEFSGKAGAPYTPAADVIEESEWWIKFSPAVGGAEGRYDFPPHVVRVRSTRVDVLAEPLAGNLVLRDSPWDPYTELLPMREQLSAELVTARHLSRDITVAGKLDPDAFWPHADVIGGSRWPGRRGGPRR